jgi:hypothetical protein
MVVAYALREHPSAIRLLQTIAQRIQGVSADKQSWIEKPIRGGGALNKYKARNFTSHTPVDIYNRYDDL